MDPIPVMPEGMDKADYWFIQVGGDEWMFVVRKLITTHMKDAKEEEVPIAMMALDGLPLFLLRKKFLPAEVLVKATGLTIEQIEKAEVIRLIVRNNPDLPTPTVNYWGNA